MCTRYRGVPRVIICRAGTAGSGIHDVCDCPNQSTCIWSERTSVGLTNSIGSLIIHHIVYQSIEPVDLTHIRSGSIHKRDSASSNGTLRTCGTNRTLRTNNAGTSNTLWTLRTG